MPPPVWVPAAAVAGREGVMVWGEARDGSPGEREGGERGEASLAPGRATASAPTRTAGLSLQYVQRGGRDGG